MTKAINEIDSKYIDGQTPFNSNMKNQTDKNGEKSHFRKFFNFIY